MIITIEAEDRFDFKDRLAEITAPTLVVAGDKDPYYTEMLFRETASGIPHARLILYAGMGHPAAGGHFEQDVRRFLTAQTPTRATAAPKAPHRSGEPFRIKHPGREITVRPQDELGA